MGSAWNDLDRDGFCLFRQAVSTALLQPLDDEAELLASQYPEQAHGLRGVLQLSKLIRDEAESFFGLALQREARPLRAILFDKRPEANWRIGWHQDTNLKENDTLLVSNDDLERVHPTPPSRPHAEF